MLLTWLVAFAISWTCVRLLLSWFRGLALDQPNERSLHERPVPRTGGIAVIAGISISLAFGSATLWVSMSLAAILAVVSFVDDIRALAPSVRLVTHLCAATVVVVSILTPADWVWAMPLVLAVTWITNLYNFMDGSDGLAGGMAVIGFGAYGLAAHQTGDFPLSALSLALSGGAAAFLLYNFYPARIFLGDVGSIPLGFLAGALGLAGWSHGSWPLWFPLLVFGPFVGDATLTLAKRVLRRERVWRAHREHYYQRMVRMGRGHRGTAMIGYVAMVFCAACALLGRDQPPALQAGAFLLGSAVLGALAIWVDLRWRRHGRTEGIAA